MNTYKFEYSEYKTGYINVTVKLVVYPLIPNGGERGGGGITESCYLEDESERNWSVG